MQLIITEYAILSNSNYELLVVEVNKLLKVGWQPHAGPYTACYNESQFIQQAMVKYKPLIECKVIDNATKPFKELARRVKATGKKTITKKAKLKK